jgi:hypothetical protein
LLSVVVTAAADADAAEAVEAVPAAVAAEQPDASMPITARELMTVLVLIIYIVSCILMVIHFYPSAVHLPQQFQLRILLFQIGILQVPD